MSIDRIKTHLDSGRLSVTVMDDGSGVVLDGEREALFNMNSTGLFIIDQIRRGSDSIDAVADALATTFQIKPSTARSDATRFIRDLSATL
jgi:hypothetical protein